eukprot:5383110-Amphidinium_carterae.1
MLIEYFTRKLTGRVDSNLIKPSQLQKEDSLRAIDKDLADLEVHCGRIAAPCHLSEHHMSLFLVQSGTTAAATAGQLGATTCNNHTVNWRARHLRPAISRRRCCTMTRPTSSSQLSTSRGE